MKSSNSRTKKTVNIWGSIERWTVERLDRDAGMARIETVPMQPKCLTNALMKQVSVEGLEAGIDRISLWDLSRVRIRRMTIRSLEKKISGRGSEIKTLSENMVFWALYPEKDRYPKHILHATRAARQAAKDLYKRVTREGGGKS